jgi:hypothetical protein
MEQRDVKVQQNDYGQRSLRISCDVAYQYYRDFLYEKGTKSATFEHAQKILDWFHVEILPKPIDTKYAKQWRSQKNNLVLLS